MRPEVELLKHHADLLSHGADALRRQTRAPARFVLGKAERFAMDLDCSGVGFLEEREATQQGALARAGRADHASRFSLRDFEIDLVQDFNLTEALAEAADDDGGFAHAGANRKRERRASAMRPNHAHISVSPQ